MRKIDGTRKRPSGRGEETKKKYKARINNIIKKARVGERNKDRMNKTNAPIIITTSQRLKRKIIPFRKGERAVSEREFLIRPSLS